MLALDWTTAVWFLPFVAPIAVWVALSDLKTMRIPNKAVLALLAVFFAVGLVALPLETWLWRWSHFGVMLVIGFALNAAGGFGAGDAKFAAAMAPFVALPDVVEVVALFAVLSIVTFLLHRAARRSDTIRARFPDWESWSRKEFPAGLALGPTLLAYLLIGVLAA